MSERSLVLTTHLVPSLPIGLFEVLVEAIEVATEKPVVLLYESRSDRPVAKEVVDIGMLLLLSQFLYVIVYNDFFVNSFLSYHSTYINTYGMHVKTDKL